MDKIEITAKQYFEDLKDKKNKIEDSALEKVYENCMTLLNKYKITGQKDAMKKLIFHLECVEKEREIVKKGIDTFIYLSDIKEYIEKVPKRVVKCIELERFEREIPDDIVMALSEVKDLFDEFFVVFTDYTREHEKKIEKERDPILFGMFKQVETSTVIERMYFIGDWEDEYCDLTLDKMVNEMKSITSKNIERTVNTPEDIEELKKQLYSIDKNMKMTGTVNKKSFKQKIGKIFNRA